MAWLSSHLCVGKRRTLRSTIVTVFSHMTRHFSFCHMWHDFSIFFWKLPQIQTSKFCKVVWQHTWRHGGKYMSFVGNLLVFPAVKEFRKSVKNWQSYRHEFGVLLFLGHSVDRRCACCQMKYLDEVKLSVWLYAGPHTFSLPWQYRLPSAGKALPGTTSRMRNVDSSGCGEVMTSPSFTPYHILSQGFQWPGEPGRVGRSLGILLMVNKI